MKFMKTFATAEEFYEFCADRDASAELLAEIKGHTLAEWWETTEHGDWMLWLEKYGVWTFTAPAEAEYEQAKAAAWAEHEQAIAAAWAEYLRAEAPVWAEYERARAVALRAIVGNPWKDKAGGPER